MKLEHVLLLGILALVVFVAWYFVSKLPNEGPLEFLTRKAKEFAESVGTGVFYFLLLALVILAIPLLVLGFKVVGVILLALALLSGVGMISLGSAQASSGDPSLDLAATREAETLGGSVGSTMEQFLDTPQPGGIGR